MQDRFGRFLVARGLIPPETLLRALRRQAALRPDPLLTALDMGLLSDTTALAVSDDMAESGAAFAEAALEGQFLTRLELARLERRLAEATPRLGQVLVSMGCLTEAALREALVAFAAQQKA